MLSYSVYHWFYLLPTNIPEAEFEVEKPEEQTAKKKKVILSKDVKNTTLPLARSN